MLVKIWKTFKKFNYMCNLIEEKIYEIYQFIYK